MILCTTFPYLLKFIELKSIFKILVQIDNYGPPKKAVQCWNCQGFFHINTQCLMDPKCVGCGKNHHSPQYPRKIIENSCNEEKTEKLLQFAAIADNITRHRTKDAKIFHLNPNFEKHTRK